MASNTTLIMVTFNSKALLSEVKNRLQATPIIIVDNASGDGSVEWLQQHWPSARLIANVVNEGYGRAINRAMAQVTTPYAMVINPDLELACEQVYALEAMAESIDHDFLCIAPNTGEMPIFLAHKAAPLTQLQWASGSALFFKRDVFWRLNGFDTNIFLFFEETDLCRRAVDKDIPIYYAESILCPHGIGASVALTEVISQLKIWHYQWSKLYYLRKHGQFVMCYLSLAKILITYPLKLKLYKVGEAKRAIYCARLAAAKAFAKGRTAFDLDDRNIF